MNAYQMENPEAFDTEWEEEQAVLAQMAKEAYEAKQASDAVKLGLILDVALAKLTAEMHERGEDFEPQYFGEMDESMDGDHESALASCGWGTDEDYGGFSHDWEDGGE